MADQPTPETNATAIKNLTAADKAYNVLLLDIAKNTKKATSEFDQLRKIIPGMTKELGQANSAAQLSTALLAKKHGLTLEADIKEYESKKDFLTQTLADLKSQGDANRDVVLKRAAAHNELRELENKHTDTMLKNIVAQGQASGGLKMVLQGAVAQVELHGKAIAEGVGNVVGASGAQMVELAKVATIGVGVFMALKYAIEGTAGAARDAAKAGLELGTGIEADYMGAIRKAAGVGPGGLISALPQAQVAAALQEASQHFLYSVGQTGESYQQEIAEGHDKIRRTHRLATVGFVADAMFLGQTFGIEGTEAVKMATTMGTLGRANKSADGALQGTLRSFALMAEYSIRTNRPMTQLMGTFSQLASVFSSMNFTTAQLTSLTTDFYDVMAKGKGTIVGMKDLRGPEVQARVEDAIKQLSSVDFNRRMALNVHPGEQFESILNRTYNDKFQSIQEAAVNAGVRMGLGDYMKHRTGQKDQKETNFNDLKVALALGLHGQNDELIMAGSEIRKLSLGGALSEESLNKINGDMIERRFNQAKSVGQNIAMGADVMQVIAGTLTNILHILVEWANGLNRSRWFSGISSQTAAATQAGWNAEKYGNSAAGGRVNWSTK